MATAATKVAEFVFEWEGRDRNGKQVRGETRAAADPSDPVSVAQRRAAQRRSVQRRAAERRAAQRRACALARCLACSSALLRAR